MIDGNGDEVDDLLVNPHGRRSGSCGSPPARGEHQQLVSVAAVMYGYGYSPCWSADYLYPGYPPHPC